MTRAVSGILGHVKRQYESTKEVVRQKIIAARDLIKCHPLTPELATELFTGVVAACREMHVT